MITFFLILAFIQSVFTFAMTMIGLRDETPGTVEFVVWIIVLAISIFVGVGSAWFLFSGF